MRRVLSLAALCALVAGALPFVAARAQVPPTPVVAARDTEPVVLTGASFVEWAVPHDVNAYVDRGEALQCEPYETCDHSEYKEEDFSSQEHLGLEGTPVEKLLGYRWTGSSFEQIPFQVDEMFTRYLANDNSGFAFYSGSDQHSSYAFDQERFRWHESDPEDPCLSHPASPKAKDPVPGLDTDDELVFMARDAGAAAPSGATLPPGIEDSYQVAVVDPTTGDTGFVYVMQASAEGPAPAFDETNGYVVYERDADADVFLYSQSSFGNYGAARHGPYFDPETGECITDEPLQHRPGDQATITTPRYRFRYEGRWLMTELRINNDDDGEAVTAPAETSYGPDLVDQWKARAFQQRPAGKTPCCGFEEEVNNWGGSSILMGERYGPVRTIRETWGADSGTNVVRREIFYRDEIRFGAFLRVHVIPPLDGIYAQWDYNAGVVETYYNQFRPDGVPIDGKNDEAFGNSRLHAGPDGVTYNGNDTVSDGLDEVTGSEEQGAGEANERSCEPTGPHAEAYRMLPEDFRNELQDNCIFNDIDSPDPTFSGVNAGLNYEVIAGPSGTVVTRSAIKQYTPGGAAQSLLAVPYYRDDACFDDGTGSDPGPHIHGRGIDGDQEADSTYLAENGERLPRECWDSDNPEHPAVPGADPRFYQGSVGTHGVHLLLIAESDNARTTLPLTELDTEQRMVVLRGDAGNVGETYGRHSEKPLIVTAAPEDRDQGTVATPSPTGTKSPSATPSSTTSQSATPTTTPTKSPTASTTSSSTPTNNTSAGGGSSSSRPPSASPSAAGTEPGRVETSIAASRDVVKYGKGFELSGQLAGPRNCAAARIVNISRREHGTTTLEHVGSAVSKQDGSWSIGFIAHANASYVATPASDAACEGNESTPVTVLVRARLSAGPQGDCRGGTRITGSVRPRSPGSTVRMERRHDGRWEKLSFTLVSRSSRFRLHAPGCGRYRIRWLDNDPTNAPASLELNLRR